MHNLLYVTEGRLHAALHRLLEGKPERVKKTGKLSLNKINNEAGLGHSYIHKFDDFVSNVANPAIEKYNNEYDRALFDVEASEQDQSEVAKLKSKLKKEKELKEKYRKQRDDAITCQKELEKLNSTLMFRVYELQDELRLKKVVRLNNVD